MARRNRKSLFRQIIDLPKTSWRVVETPTVGERIAQLFLWTIVKIALTLALVIGKLSNAHKRTFGGISVFLKFNLRAPEFGLRAIGKQLTAWTQAQSARYQLAGILLSIFTAVVAEKLLFTLFSPLTPAIAAAG
jgi:hypothetical protein